MAMSKPEQMGIAIIGPPDAHTLNVQCAAERYGVDVIDSTDNVAGSLSLAGAIASGDLSPRALLLNPDMEPGRTKLSRKVASTIVDVLAAPQENFPQTLIIGYGAILLAEMEPPIPCNRDLSAKPGALDAFFKNLRADD